MGKVIFFLHSLSTRISRLTGKRKKMKIDGWMSIVLFWRKKNQKKIDFRDLNLLQMVQR